MTASLIQSTSGLGGESISYAFNEKQDHIHTIEGTDTGIDELTCESILNVMIKT